MGALILGACKGLESIYKFRLNLLSLIICCVIFKNNTR